MSGHPYLVASTVVASAQVTIGAGCQEQEGQTPPAFCLKSHVFWSSRQVGPVGKIVYWLWVGWPYILVSLRTVPVHACCADGIVNSRPLLLSKVTQFG